jgi:pimeloyl-ACP methyl ester carboxylesterase
MLTGVDREEFDAPVAGGTLHGWMSGAGRNVLVLHGGPGMTYTYVDGIAEELGSGYRVASYQQRGLPPSVEAGPYDVPTAVADVGAVLDHLGWSTAVVVGHSWGGHLGLHVAVSLADRLDGLLCLDSLGGVGDGGEKGMGEAFAARVPPEVMERADALDERAMSGEGTEDDALEGVRMIWPAYFADWDSASPCPDDMRLSLEAYSQTFESIHALLPELETALPSISVATGFVVGAASPLPPSASHETAERIPGAWVEVVDGAGHMLWMERAGCVRPALERLIAD